MFLMRMKLCNCEIVDIVQACHEDEEEEDDDENE